MCSIKKSFFKFILATMVSALLSFAPVAAVKTLAKVYDLDYRHNTIIQMYRGGKATVRLHDIPHDAEAIQVTMANDSVSSEAKILGPNNLTVNHGAGSNFVEFNIEIPETKRKSLRKMKLNIKAFKKTDESGYEILEKIENYINPLSCVDGKEDEICQLIKLRCKDDGECIEGNGNKTLTVI